MEVELDAKDISQGIKNAIRDTIDEVFTLFEAAAQVIIIIYMLTMNLIISFIRKLQKHLRWLRKN